ncbi:MAG: 3-deoxy-7-phosphoheptulonate synthase [Candidatus Saccharicenans sp.]|uniref:3-deoxy-7-phosphoheptulonate synthase n=1 Tax=Candidatus Saccharicenans sp. TaxID=2819258 RepID=UPI00404A5362
MLIVMKPGASVKAISRVLKRVRELGLKPNLSKGRERTLIGVIGRATVEPDYFEALPEVDKVILILSPFKLASREFKPEASLIKINGFEIGGKKIVMMGGPCAVESREQIREIALALKELGVKFLRGGAYKPRSSPYSFQGLKEKGLEYLAEVKRETGLAIVTEVMSPEEVEGVSQVADILQIGTRNMHNYSLLQAVGQSDKPVLLKRGFMATIEEFLMSAEYILSNGNPRVILCERGIRTFERLTRNTFDVSAIPLLKKLSHLPVIADPSHGTGMRDLVSPVSKAAIAAGADGLLIEVHKDPQSALSDGAQSLDFKMFRILLEELRDLCLACRREI